MAAIGQRRAPPQARSPARLRSLATPAVLLVAFWALAVTLSLSTGQAFWLLNFGWIGTSVATGWALFVLLPRPKRVWGRRLAQGLVGSYMLGFLGLYGRENMQLEGFFFLLAAGFVGGAVVHYLVAKLVGPLLFGRGWCGWACWTAAVLDLLPFDRPAGREGARWGWGRYAMFGGSLGLVSILLTAGYRGGGFGPAALGWLVAGNLVYYLAGVALAFTLHDNRAFCKYLCPVAVPMKVGARLALLKIGGDGSRCTDCGACERACPMDVKVGSYLRSGQRVLSTECILCQLCVNGCPREVPRVTFGLDLGGRQLLRPARSVEPRRAA